MPEAPASSAVVRLTSSFLGTRTMTWALPSEWCWAAWMALFFAAKKIGQSVTSCCRQISRTPGDRMKVYSLVELEAVPNAVFHVNPDEVWLGRGEHLRETTHDIYQYAQVATKSAVL